MFIKCKIQYFIVFLLHQYCVSIINIGSVLKSIHQNDSIRYINSLDVTNRSISIIAGSASISSNYLVQSVCT